MTREELLSIAEQKYDEVPVLVLASAIDYATEKHARQKRKSGESYINHPLAVAEILIEWGMDIDTVVAGGGGGHPRFRRHVLACVAWTAICRTPRTI